MNQCLRFEVAGSSAHIHSMKVDSLPAIAGGRAISAYPKKLGAPARGVYANTLVDTLGRLPREARP